MFHRTGYHGANRVRRPGLTGCAWQRERMFTGIIDKIGHIRSSLDTSGGKRLVITAADYWIGVVPGASIAVDGVCLTVTQIADADAHFDVVAETVRRSTLGDLRPDNAVNLQKALAVGDRLDGHFVQGHVDAVARIARKEEANLESKWWFAMDAEPMAFVIPKGSVAIDGVSLTVADVREGEFSVALIPTTLAETTLGQKHVGDVVNVETDILARTIVHSMKSMMARGGQAPGSLTMEFLRQHGFA